MLREQIDLKDAMEVAEFMKRNRGKTIVFAGMTASMSSHVTASADVVVGVIGKKGTIIKEKVAPPPPPPVVYTDTFTLESWSYTGAVRVRPRWFGLGCVLEEQVQKLDGTSDWVRVTAPIIIDKGTFNR